MRAHSGIRIREVVERAMDPSNMDETVRLRTIDLLVRHLKCALRFQRRLTRRNVIVHKTIKVLNLTYAAGFISTMYLFTKVLYLVNVIIQLYLMNKFLETDKYQWYGFGVIRDILNGTKWETSGAFPRVSVCDFSVRQVANIQRYSVQCVLVINIFNEKIFILLWFWYMAVMLMTIYSVFYWTILMGFPCFGRWFVGQNLEMSELKFDSTAQHKQVARFVNEYLRQDGVFVIRMVTMHSGVIFGTDLVLALWKVFYGIESTPTDAQSEQEDEKNNKVNYLKNAANKNSTKDNTYDMERLTKRRKNKDSTKSKHNSDTLDSALMPLHTYDDHDERSDDSRESKERKERGEKRYSTENPCI
uniref:Innexin n=1 Tax=Steinernema glaseri TaxID=37863 RepID=A0A1I8AKI9_9BILA